jgi:hypothetical protein
MSIRLEISHPNPPTSTHRDLYDCCYRLGGMLASIQRELERNQTDNTSVYATQASMVTTVASNLQTEAAGELTDLANALAVLAA